MLLTRFAADPKQNFRKAVFDRVTRSKQTAQPGVIVVAVLPQRFEVQGPFVAKRVIKTLLCNPHFAHQNLQRRMLVAKTPEYVHCRIQCLARFKFFSSSNIGLYSLICLSSHAGTMPPAELQASLMRLAIDAITQAEGSRTA